MTRSRYIDGKGASLALVDIGTTKIVCMIVAPEALGWRLLGYGYQRSRGMKAGVVVDIEQAEDAVRATISQAETMAGINLEDVHIAVACGRLKSLNFTARADAADGIVQDDDIARLMHAARVYAERDGRCIVAMNRISWSLDGVGGIEDPIGLAARGIEAEVHVATADDAPLRNILSLIERCRLGVAQISVTAHASALAVTSPDERQLGVTVVDCGGGVTSIAEFFEGHLVGVHAIPVGGSHVTYDIAKALSTTVAEAERIKTCHGSLVQARSDAHERITYQHVNGEDATLADIGKMDLRSMIAPRIDMLLASIAERVTLGSAGMPGAGRFVLTGGASAMSGLDQHAAEFFGRPARAGRPFGLGGMPDSLSGPGFATIVGLLPLALDREAASYSRGMLDGAVGREQSGYFGRVGRWIKESF